MDHHSGVSCVGKQVNLLRRKKGRGGHNQEHSVFGMTRHREKYQLHNYSMPAQNWYLSLNKPFKLLL